MGRTITLLTPFSVNSFKPLLIDKEPYLIARVQVFLKVYLLSYLIFETIQPMENLLPTKILFRKPQQIFSA